MLLRYFVVPILIRHHSTCSGIAPGRRFIGLFPRIPFLHLVCLSQVTAISSPVNGNM